METALLWPAMTLSALALLLAVVAWETVWKGLGLWKAAQNKDKVWFVALMIVNSIGILPMIYIFLVSKKK